MRIWSFDCVLPSFTAMKISLNLRVKVRSCVKYAFFTYCWVIVDPPCTSPPARSTHIARRMPVGEMPGSDVKLRSSADRTAFCTTRGT